MPYIKPDLRPSLEFLNPIPSNVGELNYAISALIHQYVNAKGISYETLNSVVGVLDCARMEFYRTVVAPYEDTKARENRAVSNLDTPFFVSSAPSVGPVEISGPSTLDIGTLTASIVAAMRAAEKPAPAAAPVAARKAKRPTTGPFPPPPAEPAQEAPLARGEAKVLQGPIPGDTPAPASGAQPPRVTRPAQDRLPPPGPNASAAEKALYDLAEGEDDL